MTEYKKKLRNRLFLAIGYIVIGSIMLIAAYITKSENSFIMPFGVALLVCGAVRVADHFRVTRNEQSVQKQRIKETDERNLDIISRARSLTFTLYIVLAGTAVIVLQFAGMQEQSQMIAYSVCFFVALYWVCYQIMKRRS